MKKLSLSQLEQHLSHAAWILKGPVDGREHYFSVPVPPITL